ncbi:ATP-binding protein (plasmid) [Leptospira sp. WS39.C2]
MSGGLWFASGKYFKRLKFVKAWSLVSLLQAFGWITMGALRGQIPDWISISVGNSLIFISLVFYHSIILNLFGEKPQWKVGLIAAFILCLLLIFHHFSSFPQQYRISIISFATGIQLLVTSKIIFDANKKAKLTSNFNFYFYLLSGLFLLGRFIIYTFTEVSVSQIAFGKGPIQDITYLFLYVTSVLMTFGFLLMCIDIFIKGQIENEEKYRLLAENSTDVIWVWNFRLSKFTYISPSVTSITGYTVKEAISKHLSSTYSEKSYSELMNLLASRLEEFKINKLKIPYTYELEQFCKDGTTIWIEANTVFQFNYNDEIEILGVSRDIDSRKKSDLEKNRYFQELQLLNYTKDKFFSIIAHDLKGPIGGMNTFIGMILEDLENRPIKRTKNDLNILYQSSGEVYALLENLLTWARSQTEEISFMPETISVYGMVETVISYVTFMIQNKEIQIQNSVDREVTAFADEKMLETILRNLISNAIKYSHIGGKVIIKSESNVNLVTISVEDFGTGISEEIRNNLFRIDSKQKSMPGTLGERGTALGLILCKEFIEKNGGNINVKSEVGVGSKFYFTLPKQN